MLRALAFNAPVASTLPSMAWLRRTTLDVVQLDQHRQVPVALAVTGMDGLELVALDATWAGDADGIVDAVGGCLLLSPIKLDGDNAIEHAGKAIEFLFARRIRRAMCCSGGQRRVARRPGRVATWVSRC